MNKHLIYDVPTRLFHWLFAALFVGAFLVAKTVDDESPVFSYHMLAGLMLGFTVLLRLIWGVVGTRYSRFSSFGLHPREVVIYFSSLFSGEKRKWAGHNPASSWATLLMFAFALGLALTGLLMTNGQKEAFEEVHEFLANGFLIVVLLHIAGVVLHALRHRDGIFGAMTTGQKTEVPSPEPVKPARSVGVLFVLLVTLFAFYLGKGLDAGQGTLRVFGARLRLSEGEKGQSSLHPKEGAEEPEHDEDD